MRDAGWVAGTLPQGYLVAPNEDLRIEGVLYEFQQLVARTH